MKKATVIFFSVLLLLTNTGIVFATHSCGGMLVSVSIGWNAKASSCGMMEEEAVCALEDGLQLTSQSCCSDDLLQLTTEDQFDVPVVVPLILELPLPPLSLSSELFTCQLSNVFEVVYKDYFPPPIVQDVPVLYQSFLI